MNSATKLSSGVICGKKYSIAVTEFNNKDLIIISDNGKIGTLVEISFAKNPVKTECTINAKTLLGIDTLEVHAVAQSIVTELEMNKPVVFGFSNKEFNAQVAKDMVKLVSSTLKKETT